MCSTPHNEPPIVQLLEGFHLHDDGEDVYDYDNTGDVKLNKDEKFYLIL